MRLKLAQTCVYLSQKHIYFKTNVNVDAHRLLFLLVGDLLTIRFQCLVTNILQMAYYAFSNFQMLSS